MENVTGGICLLFESAFISENNIVSITKEMEEKEIVQDGQYSISAVLSDYPMIFISAVVYVGIVDDPAQEISYAFPFQRPSPYWKKLLEKLPLYICEWHHV